MGLHAAARVPLRHGVQIPSGSWISPRYLERTGQPAGAHSGLRWRRQGFEDHIQLGHLLGATARRPLSGPKPS